MSHADNANPNTVTEEYIDSLISSPPMFDVLSDGRTTICSIPLLDDTFTVRGESSVICRENFDAELGRKYALENARSKCWQIAGAILAACNHYSGSEPWSAPAGLRRDQINAPTVPEDGTTISYEDIQVGSFVTTKTPSGFTDDHVVAYKYGNQRIVSAMGLGKSDSYPLLVDDIVSVDNSSRPVIYSLHNEPTESKHLIWADIEGRPYISTAFLYDGEISAYQGSVRGPILLSLATSTINHNKLLGTNIVDFAFLYQVSDLILVGSENSSTPLDGAFYDRARLLAEKFAASLKSKNLENSELTAVDVERLAKLLGREPNDKDIDTGAHFYVSKEMLASLCTNS